MRSCLPWACVLLFAAFGLIVAAAQEAPREGHRESHPEGERDRRHEGEREGAREHGEERERRAEGEREREGGAHHEGERPREGGGHHEGEGPREGPRHECEPDPLHAALDEVVRTHVLLFDEILREFPEDSGPDAAGYCRAIGTYLFGSAALIADCENLGADEANASMAGFLSVVLPSFQGIEAGYRAPATDAAFEQHLDSLVHWYGLAEARLVRCRVGDPEPEPDPPGDPDPPTPEPGDPPAVGGVPAPNPPSRAPDWTVWAGKYRNEATGAVSSDSDPLGACYRRAKWGDVIAVQGRVGHFRAERAPATGPVEPISIVGQPGAVVSGNPVSGSDTVAIKDQGMSYTRIYDLTFDPDDRACVMMDRAGNAGWTYPGIEFYDCTFSAGGWSWSDLSGMKDKWGLLTYALEDFWMVGCTVETVGKEHAIYSHNAKGGVHVIGCTFVGTGRTATQWTARKGEGGPATGDFWLVGNHCLSNNLEQGGGGSSLSINGGAPLARWFIIRHNSRQGFDPSIHPSHKGNVTGGLVVHDGGNAHPGGNGEIYIEDSYFSVGPESVGVGSARRANLSFQDRIRSVTIVGTTAVNHPGAAEVLSIAQPSLIGSLTLDRGNDIRGECVYGAQRFKDPGLTGAGYRAMLAAIGNNPGVSVVDWSGPSLWPEGGVPGGGSEEPAPEDPPPHEDPPAGEDPPEEPPVGHGGIQELPGLWSWVWAGQGGSLSALSGKTIQRLSDSSGNGNDWTAGPSPAGYRTAVSLPSDTKGGAYRTRLPAVGVDRFEDGSQHFGNTYRFTRGAFSDPDDWYLVAVVGNTRKTGQRELWGLDSRNFLQMDQGVDSLSMTIDGRRAVLGAAGSVPAGVQILEVWRQDGIVHAAANGRLLGQAFLGGQLTLSGVGWDGSGSSHWDDYLFELALCSDVPGPAVRAAVLGELAAKWGLQLAP